MTTMGQLIQELSTTLEAMKRMNAANPVQIKHDIGMVEAITKLKDLCPGKYVYIHLELDWHSHSSAKIEYAFDIYDGKSHYRNRSLSLALAQAISANTVRETTIKQAVEAAGDKGRDDADVLDNLTDKIVPEDKMPTTEEIKKEVPF